MNWKLKLKARSLMEYKTTPIYKMAEITGVSPAGKYSHACTVYINKSIFSTGTGKTIEEAKQLAAKLSLKLFPRPREKEDEPDRSFYSKEEIGEKVIVATFNKYYTPDNIPHAIFGIHDIDSTNHSTYHISIRDFQDKSSLGFDNLVTGTKYAFRIDHFTRKNSSSVDCASYSLNWFFGEVKELS